MVEHMTSHALPVDSFAVVLPTSTSIEAPPATHYTRNHPSTSPNVANYTKLPYITRANSASSELISLPATAAAPLEFSDGSCATELSVDPSRSVTPESHCQPTSRHFTGPHARSKNLDKTLDSVPPVSSSLGDGQSYTIFNSRNNVCPTATWRRVQHFIKVITHSPLIASALAALDVAGHPSVGDQAPAAAGGDALRWTLSAMLAVFLRSNAHTVCEESLLAMLWTMESWSDARRSPATLVLGDYLRHLAAFDSERAEMMSATWRESFCALRSAVVNAQVELLQSVEWNVRLSDGAILHCHKLLFGALPVSSNSTLEGSTASEVAAAAAAEAEAWSAAAAASLAASKRRMWRDPSGACADQVNALCACIVAQSSRIAAAEARKALAASAAAAVVQSVPLQRKRAASPTVSASGSEESSYDSAPLAKRFRSVSAEKISFRSSQ